MPMAEKLTSAEIVHKALVWAEESMLQMIGGLDDADPHKAVVTNEYKQLVAYRKRRYGTPPDPFKGTRLVGMDELRKMRDSSSSRPREKS